MSAGWKGPKFPERWSLSYRQMLDAAVDLIQRDIRDTPCPFGSPRWHISGCACTLAVFNPALFILRGLWLMLPVLRAHRSVTARLTLFTVICVFIMCPTYTFWQTRQPASTPWGLKHTLGDWILFCCMRVWTELKLEPFLPQIHALAAPIIIFCW